MQVAGGGGRAVVARQYDHDRLTHSTDWPTDPLPGVTITHALTHPIPAGGREGGERVGVPAVRDRLTLFIQSVTHSLTHSIERGYKPLEL